MSMSIRWIWLTSALGRSSIAAYGGAEKETLACWTRSGRRSWREATCHRGWYRGIGTTCLALQLCLSAGDLGKVPQPGTLKPELLSRPRLYQPD